MRGRVESGTVAAFSALPLVRAAQLSGSMMMTMVGFTRLAAAGGVALLLAACASDGTKKAAEVDPNSVVARAEMMQPAVTRLPPKPARPPRAALCLTSDELRAEEVIQFHSRLMVVALTCRTQRADVDLYRTYMEFTQRHQDVIRRSEQTLIDRLRRTGWQNPGPRFDNWRSKVANELSTDAARGGLRAFCTAAAEELLEAAKLPPGEFSPDVIPATYAMPAVDNALCSTSTPRPAATKAAVKPGGTAAPAANKTVESKPKSVPPAATPRPAAQAKPTAPASGPSTAAPR